MPGAGDTPSRTGVGSFVFSLAAGILGAWSLVALEIFVLGLRAKNQLSGIWEVQMGTIGLLPSWLLLATLPGVLGAFLFLALESAHEASGTRSRKRIAVSIAMFFAVTAYGVGGGRHLATWEVRSAFAFAVAALAGGLGYLVVPWLRRCFVSSHVGSAGTATFLGVLALETANEMILVRLYPAFHGALSALSLLLGGMAGARLERELNPRRPHLFLFPTVIAVLVSAAALLPASRAVSGFDNFRWIVSERSPTLNWGTLLAGQVAPPPDLDESLAELPLGQRRQGDGVDLRGRDILLISIDALRADHVGAYGYKRKTTPTIDALAKQGVTFDAAYAPTPHTSYSVTSLMTGKYMRPLLLQGSGADSDLWATLLQAYDYRTAAFYPPAVFFIDTKRFEGFQRETLGFEYAKVEFAEGSLRVQQYREYVAGVPRGRRIFSWVHLFGPHEPYEKHNDYDFGHRDLDLYDSEIRAADETVKRIVEIARARDPNVIVILTADHGEEFGDHGGRYHGTTVFDEQVRVPLVISGAGLAQGRRIQEPVQTIDLLPTILSALKIPGPPRLRGRDLSSHLGSSRPSTPDDLGRAIAETDDYTLLAEGAFRLICQRKSGACQLFNIQEDPAQLTDVSSKHPKKATEMRERARSIAQTHGKYESQGLRAEGKGWPSAILLGISGNADVAPTLATLLDDADVGIRRKAAELLFSLGDTGQAPALRLAMTREEDTQARAWVALALTRLGQGAPLVFELLSGSDQQFRHLAALALAEAGNSAGEKTLVEWWANGQDLEHEMALRLLTAFAHIRSEEAVPHLIHSLDNVRLRPFLADTLATIGERDALPHLALRLGKERYQSARLPLAKAIVALGGDEELIVPLRRFLGVPDRLLGGLGLAREAGVLADVGGPKEAERGRLQQLSDSGLRLTLVVPPAPKHSKGVRLIVRARSLDGLGGEILIEPALPRINTRKSTVRARNQPEIQSSKALRIAVPSAPSVGAQASFVEVETTLPARFGARPGHHLGLEVFAPGGLEVESLAAVPLREDLPPPPPEPWEPGSAEKRSKPAESVEIPSP